MIVRLAPFGKTTTDLPLREFNRTEGILELGWEGRPNCICRLVKQNESLFQGNCIEDNKVMPIAIRVANENDYEWMGSYFPVSETDIQILKKAKEILLSKDSRNLNGERNCYDDMQPEILVYSVHYTMHQLKWMASTDTEDQLCV